MYQEEGDPTDPYLPLLIKLRQYIQNSNTLGITNLIVSVSEKTGKILINKVFHITVCAEYIHMAPHLLNMLQDDDDDGKLALLIRKYSGNTPTIFHFVMSLPIDEYTQAGYISKLLAALSSDKHRLTVLTFSQDTHFESPLHNAIYTENLPVLQAMLDALADINNKIGLLTFKKHYAYPVLQSAFRANNTKIIALLLKALSVGGPTLCLEDLEDAFQKLLHATLNGSNTSVFHTVWNELVPKMNISEEAARLDLVIQQDDHINQLMALPLWANSNRQQQALMVMAAVLATSDYPLH